MIKFDEHAHKYTDEQGRTYISATQLIGNFKQPFDAVAVSEAYAKKNGGTPEFWRQKWEENRDNACERGTIFHKEKEDLLLGRGVEVTGGKVGFVQNQELLMRNILDLIDLPDGMYPELRIWHEGYLIAGTADKVLIDTVGKLRYVDIDDHKTNKAIYKESYKNWKTGHKMMIFPLNHLMDCNFQHYEIQLSLYAFMLEAAGFIPRNLQFTHYPHDGGEPVVYKVKYRRKEVMGMIKEYRYTNKLRK